MEKLAKDLMALLAEFIAELRKEKEPNEVHTRNERALVKAASKLGTYEWKKGSNPVVEEFHKYATKDNKVGMSDDVPWCASFVCWVLEMVGMGSTNSKMARSYTKWGRSTLKNPLPGDIVVYWRGSKNGSLGHVGFFLKEVNGLIYTLGGNQNDAVNISKYDRSRVLDIRRSSKARKYTDYEQAQLRILADKIIAGEKVEIGGSVT